MDVKEVRSSRTKGIVVFAKFCQDKKNHEDCIFCFFEGEDYKYYDSRIEKYTKYNFEKTINYDCGGRKEVMKAYELISGKEEYANINKMFFIDRDFIPIEEKNKDLYQTPCYSVENFYTSSSSFSRILNREFGVNTIDSDFNKCINDYIERQKEFHSCTRFLNAWLSCQRKKEIIEHQEKISLSNFKISKLFSEISIEKIQEKQPIDLELLNRFFLDSYDIEDEILKKENEFFGEENQHLFRGKFEMEFLRKIIDSLKEKNKKETYFTSKRTCVNIDPNVNTLSTLSDYADTPDCLISFLENHKAESAA